MSTAPKNGSFTREELLAELSYDALTGIFKWKRTGRGRRTERAGNVKHKAYREIFFQGRSYFEHRLAWFAVHGVWPKCLIDHIDGNPGNNSISNLREATHSENHWNRPLAQQGFIRDSKSGKLKVYISVNTKHIYVGQFVDEERARSAYLVAKRKLHHEFFPLPQVSE